MVAVVGMATENQRPRKLRESFLIGFKEFRDNSSIHGVKYMFESKRPLWSRILWFASFTIALVCCTYMVIHSLNDFYIYPTIHTVEGFRYQYASFPFPAVTICNVNKFYESRARRFIDSLKIPESSMLNRAFLYRLLPKLAVLVSSETEDKSEIGSTLQRVLDYNNVSIRDAFSQLAMPCSELIQRCRWENKMEPCSDLFEEHVTFQGICCTFNYALNRKSSFPRRAFHVGAGNGLSVLLNLESHDVLPSAAISYGVEIFFHGYSDFLDEGTPQTQCGARKECWIKISPREHISWPSVRSLSARRRHCLFKDEVPSTGDGLPFTKINCRFLCRVKTTHALCGCVRFSLSTKIRQGHRVCDLRDARCLTKNRGALQSDNQCRCLSSCSNVRFLQDTIRGDFQAAQFNSDEFFENVNLSDRAAVHMYIGTESAARIYTDVSFSIQDLMSLLGGYCSFFLGCSLLSGLEIAYFTTIRVLREIWTITNIE